jgi:hypothetical protein
MCIRRSGSIYKLVQLTEAMNYHPDKPLVSKKCIRVSSVLAVIILFLIGFIVSNAEAIDVYLNTKP